VIYKPLKLLLIDLINAAQATQHTLITALNDSDRTTIGTPFHWSARDHVAHITFWKRHLSLTLAALAHSESPPSKGDTQTVNAQVFEEQRERSWEEILLDAEQVHTELLANLALFTEEDLARSDWFSPKDGDDGGFAEGQPLWSPILSQCFWHPLEHFTQFYLARNDLQRATQLQEAWIDNVRQPDVPPVIHSIGLYTLALFYATTQQAASAQEALHQALALNPDPDIESIVLYHLARCYASTHQIAQAQEMLHQALALNPNLTEFSKQDPAIASLLDE